MGSGSFGGVCLGGRRGWRSELNGVKWGPYSFEGLVCMKTIERETCCCCCCCEKVD